MRSPTLSQARNINRARLIHLVSAEQTAVELRFVRAAPQEYPESEYPHERDVGEELAPVVMDFS